jgi:quercetin dioxygenase-like cupin family protein
MKELAMRMSLILIAALGSVAAAAPVSAPLTLAQHDVTQAHGPQQVIVQTREFAAGSESGWHVHPGTEIAVVVDGTVELETPTGVLIVDEGESFTIPRGLAHNGINRESTAAALVITLVVDKDQALRISVPKPR